jgi:hypothetical protein
MKPLIVLFVFITFCYFGFLIDKGIINYILNKCPDSEWLEIIEVGLWVGMICISFSLVITISFAVAGLVAIALKGSSVQDNESIQFKYKPSTLYKNSRWLQRVEDAIKERDKKNRA